MELVNVMYNIEQLELMSSPVYDIDGHGLTTSQLGEVCDKPRELREIALIGLLASRIEYQHCMESAFIPLGKTPLMIK